MPKRYITKTKQEETTYNNDSIQTAKNSIKLVGDDMLQEKIEKLNLQIELLKVKLANAKTSEERNKINEMVTRASKELSGVLLVGQAA